MLGGFLLLITGRAQHIASLVDQRTLELESILNEAVEAIIIVNGEGHVERANPAACSLFMLLKHQLIGIEARKLIPALEELGSEDSTNNSEIISNNCIWKSREAIGICRDNSYIPIEIGVSRVELPGRYIYTCMIHDITARKKVERLKSEFISTVSHELRTPLTSINGVLGLLAAGAIPKIPPKAIDLLVIAKNNADRLGRLVNDILDIEKLEFGQLQLDVVECEINDLIRQAAVQNSGYAIKYGVNLILDKESLARYNAVVAVDTDRFLQVMSNLISNAVKYSNLDGEVTIRTKLEDRIITIYVEDKGSGIPEAFRSRVFQKFAQADSSDTRKRDGTGLGLSITKVIVERMGGKINYTTELNRGTTFYFSLPVVKNILPESE
jgi:PAS domain S-box-containing protein